MPTRVHNALTLAALALSCASAFAANLTIDTGSTRTLTTDELLARTDLATIRIDHDVSFHRTMTYRAVSLHALLGMTRFPDGAELQITGTDGFVTHLPASLLFNAGRPHAEAWLAIEVQDAPWPRLNGDDDIGPFYVVWTNPAASKIGSEQWPYKVDAIRIAQTPAARWPQLAVGRDVAASSPIRTGQTVFITQCLACHKMNGAGDASMGPDLDTPRNPTEYFQPWALKQYIRDPRSIRAWPDMKMHGFDKSMLSDADLNAVIAYLGYMAKHGK